MSRKPIIQDFVLGLLNDGRQQETVPALVKRWIVNQEIDDDNIPAVRSAASSIYAACNKLVLDGRASFVENSKPKTIRIRVNG